jgi:proline dehydrogenase
MITRSALIWLSRQEGLKDFATRFGFFKKLTTRFVAGENIDEVIPFIRQLNSENATASFDHLNESVGSAAEAEQEVLEYLNILAKIDEQRIRSNVRTRARSGARLPERAQSRG